MRKYTENNYIDKPKFTSDESRVRLCSWQIPAIKKHFNSLEGGSFIDVGAGDIVLGEHQHIIGRPNKFYVQDISEVSLNSGIDRLNSRGIDTSNIIALTSETFEFDLIDNNSIDFAFSNSLFSHLTLNSILLCLNNLRPKMKSGTKYLSSMIVVPKELEKKPYDWSYLGTLGSNGSSYPTRDPYHYSREVIVSVIGSNTGFTVKDIHDYGHPFQKLVEFVAV